MEENGAKKEIFNGAFPKTPKAVEKTSANLII
jgi:hypothetical protein